MDGSFIICIFRLRGMYWIEFQSIFFQAEDGIRDSVASRGLGDVYKRQIYEQQTSYKRCVLN